MTTPGLEFSIPELERMIYVTQNIVSSLPRSHPQRPRHLGTLAWWRFCHYRLSESPEQLEKHILHSTEALLLPLPRTGTMSDYVRHFYRLTLALDIRSKSTGFENPGSDDVTYRVKYLRCLLDQPLEAFGFPRNILKLCLVVSLKTQVISSSSSDDVTEDIRTMMILCRELFDSDPKSIIPSFISLAAGTAIATSNRNVNGELRDQAIECLRKAVDRLPHAYQLSRWFASCLIRRFEEDYSIKDYDEGIAILDRMPTELDSNEPEDTRNLDRGLALWEIAHCSYIRFLRYRKPEYMEEAISRLRTYRRSASLDPRLPNLLEHLEHLENLRVSEFGVGGVQEECSSANASNPDIADLSCLSSLIASLTESRSSITVEQWEQHRKVLQSLMLATDMGENEDAIKYCRLLLTRGNPGSELTRFVPVPLALLLYGAFINSGKLKYLDESIVVLRDCLETPNDWHRHYDILAQCRIMALSSRFRLLESREDLHELMQVYSAAVTNTQLWISERFRLSYEWASVAHNLKHPSVTAAYVNAFSIMQDSLSYAPTLENQHYRLVSMRESYEKLPSNYAAYQVHTGQVNNAIEILEHGRAMIWSELRGFRSSADQIRTVDPPLAEAFVAINEDLEKVTMSIDTYGSENHDPEGMDQFGRQMVQQRKLLEQRDKLIGHIRTLPFFGNFLKPPSFDALRSAALQGPVIIINHCKWRSDILILFHNSPPSLITTKNDFYDSALELSDRLAKNIKYGLESKQYERALRSVLKDLYELVGRPVIEKFRKMKILEQSRVWWCPTSVFCYLPLHAMGPIPSNDRIKHHFSDLYITSYTPTLSALMESRKPGGQMLGKPSILLVAQPESLPHTIPEIWAVQCISTAVTSLVSKKATASSVLEGLKNHQFTHFSCHGKLKPGEPFNASFELSGGEQLTLLDIVRSRLPSAEFAFLSACHTARVTEESIADEALHLTAAMQYCGFRSVVGTMWKMADVDGQYLVEDFYKLLLSTDEPGIPYYEGSARALRDAVKNLRRKGVPLERWVNYVHYGA
ncbi:CHAT domain-containing protein [Lactifluus volemus]|nr:CHAT domain-containing protein [Lactifluus volemus]